VGSERPVEELLAELREGHQQATFAHDPSTARIKYRVVRDGSGALLKRVNPSREPLAFVELCLLRHDTQSVLNGLVDALWHARIARTVLEDLRPNDFREDRERLGDFMVNAIRSEAVSYHNLGLAREAYRQCQEAEVAPAIRQRLSFWRAHIFRDKMNALANMPRFAISEAEGLAQQAEDACERGAHRKEERDVLVLLIRESLSRCYIRHGSARSLRKAGAKLESLVEEAETLAYVGPLHRTLVWRSHARLCWQRGDQKGWQDSVRHALDVAREAGLDHQVSYIAKEYGQALLDVFPGLETDVAFLAR
jgi:hypothetical protein